MDNEDLESSEHSSDDEEEINDEEEEPLKVQCLFCVNVSGSLRECFTHCYWTHNFDLRSFMKTYSRNGACDHYDLVKIITFIRKYKMSVDDLMQVAAHRPWQSDEYLIPVDSEDPWLWADFGFIKEEGEEEEEEDIGDRDVEMEPKYVNAENGVVTLSKEHFDELQNRNQRLELQLREEEKKVAILKSLLAEEPGAKKVERRKTSNSYFDSYSGLEIHREMLRDTPRMMTYRDALSVNMCYRKVVLDVGCGTGILSMMAASAGAVKVVGVENSDIFDAAVEIIRENGLEPTVKVVKGNISVIELEDKFDVIISEWMGYFLLFERMLESILIARDKFLKIDGNILPNRCRILLAGVSDLTTYQERVSGEVLGYTMTPLKRAAIAEPIIEQIHPSKIMCEPYIVHEIDLLDRLNVRPDNCCSFTSEFHLEVFCDCTITSICGWFSCDFKPNRVVLSTSPYDYKTHWAQTNFYLSKPHMVRASTDICGIINVEPMDEHGLKVTLEIPILNEMRTYILE